MERCTWQREGCETSVVLCLVCLYEIITALRLNLGLGAREFTHTVPNQHSKGLTLAFSFRGGALVGFIGSYTA